MSDYTDRVRAQKEAFNNKDLDALLAGLAADYEFWQVTPDGPKLLAQGPDQVRERIGAIFAAPGYLGSAVESVSAAGNVVSAVEIDRFATPDGEQSFRSLGVYEYRGDKLIRAWNFPAG